jgi:sugar lactone lactonase YvrE
MTAPEILFKSLTMLSTLALLVSCAGPQASEATDLVSNEAPAFVPDPSWPVLPEGWEWGQVIGINADSRGHIWSSTMETGLLSEWDTEGNLVQSWDAGGPDGEWRSNHGLFVDHNDYLWTTARNHAMVNKFTRDGQHVLSIGRFDETGGSNSTELLGGPADMWVDAETNEVFVADGYDNRRVIVFDAETGQYLRHWGAYGELPVDPPAAEADLEEGEGGDATALVPEAPARQFQTIHSISGSRDGLIYVGDRDNNRIQVFRRDGEFVTEKILRPHCGPEEQAAWVPAEQCGSDAVLAIALSPDEDQEYVYVADAGRHMIVVLRRSDMEILDEFGGLGVGPGELGLPHNLTVDQQGNIYVSQAAGPEIPDPSGQGTIRAGFRAQKFALVGTKQIP